MATLLLAGCGAATASETPSTVEVLHQSLNTLTVAVDPAYQLAVDQSEAAEQAIETAPGLSLEQKREQIARSRAQWDRVIAAFEAIRQAQLVARGALGLAEHTRSGDDLSEAIIEVQKVYAAWVSLRQALGTVRQGGTP